MSSFQIPPELFQLIADFCEAREASVISCLDKRIRHNFSFHSLTYPSKLHLPLLTRLKKLSLIDVYQQDRESLYPRWDREATQRLVNQLPWLTSLEELHYQIMEVKVTIPPLPNLRILKAVRGGLSLVATRDLPKLERLILAHSSIGDLNHLKSLRFLELYSCGNITEDSIRQLQLEEITLRESPIRDLSWMTSLRVIGGDETIRPILHPLIDQRGISELNLEKLVSDGSLRDLSRMSRLRYLDINGTNLETNGLQGLVNLEVLKLRGTITRVNFSFLTSLRVLHLSKADGSNVRDRDITGLINLEEFTSDYPIHITTVSHMLKLRILRIGGCHLKEVQSLTQLEELELVGNKNIFLLPHKLRYLDCRDSIVGDRSISELHQLEELDCYDSWVNMVMVERYPKLLRVNRIQIRSGNK